MQGQQQTNTRTRGRSEGFSLIELIVVITIIGILASIVVVNVGGRGDQAKAAAAQTEINNISMAAEMFRADIGRWPEDLDELMQPPEASSGFQPEPYLKKRPSDPWTQEDYYFELTDRGIRIYSYGADMVEGGDSFDKDISNEDEN